MDTTDGTVVYTYDNNKNFTYGFKYENNLMYIYLPESGADDANDSLFEYLKLMNVPNLKTILKKPMSLSFFVTPEEFNSLETTLTIENKENKHITLENLTWRKPALPPSEGGRRKTKRGKRKYRTTKKLHRRVRRR